MLPGVPTLFPPHWLSSRSGLYLPARPASKSSLFFLFAWAAALSLCTIHGPCPAFSAFSPLLHSWRGAGGCGCLHCSCSRLTRRSRKGTWCAASLAAGGPAWPICALQRQLETSCASPIALRAPRGWGVVALALPLCTFLMPSVPSCFFLLLWALHVISSPPCAPLCFPVFLRAAPSELPCPHLPRCRSPLLPRCSATVCACLSLICRCSGLPCLPLHLVLPLGCPLFPRLSSGRCMCLAGCMSPLPLPLPVTCPVSPACSWDALSAAAFTPCLRVDTSSPCILVAFEPTIW